MTFKASRSGWQPDLPNDRDVLSVAPIELAGVVPAKAALRPQFLPVYNQGGLGNCPANAVADAIEFVQLKQKLKGFTPSRLFICRHKTDEHFQSDFRTIRAAQ